MNIMPAFERFEKEALIIARLLAGYGELEYLLGILLGNALRDQNGALRALFRNRTESGRIKIADALLRKHLDEKQLINPYEDVLGVIRYCLSIRNQFSHCHWADHYEAGLFFTNLETPASKVNADFEHDWLHVDVPLLQSLETAFNYGKAQLTWLDFEFSKRSGRGENPFPMPQIPRLPNPHNPPKEHTPPWLSADAQRRHLERARAKQKSDPQGS